MISLEHWQNVVCSSLSDTDLILGMVAAYQRDACTTMHRGYPGELPTDECRMFLYVSSEPGTYKGMSKGTSDHFNMRLFKEWCQINRPQVWKRLHALKVFW
jgi:hypothetical protein